MPYYLEAAVERAMKIQEVICRTLAGTLTWIQAAEILGIQPRSLRRWRARYQPGEPLRLYERRRLPSPRKAPLEEVQRVLRLYRERYQRYDARRRRPGARSSPTMSATWSRSMSSQCPPPPWTSSSCSPTIAVASSTSM